MELQEPKLSNLLEGLKFMEDHYKQDYEKTLSVNHPYSFFLTFREQTEDLLKKGYEIKKSEPTLQEVIEVLQKHLREDHVLYDYWFKSLRLSLLQQVWNKRLSPQFKEEYDFEQLATNGAKNFLDNLIKE